MKKKFELIPFSVTEIQGYFLPLRNKALSIAIGEAWL